MKLDRTDNKDGKGKYALIKMREIPGNPRTAEELAAAILENPQCVDWGARESDSEFFLLRLKDLNAAPALFAYAESAADTDPEWSTQVYGLAKRAERHTGKKQPD